MYEPQRCSPNEQERNSDDSNDEAHNDKTQHSINDCLYNISAYIMLTC